MGIRELVPVSAPSRVERALSPSSHFFPLCTHAHNSSTTPAAGRRVSFLARQVAGLGIANRAGGYGVQLLGLGYFESPGHPYPGRKGEVKDGKPTAPSNGRQRE